MNFDDAFNKKNLTTHFLNATERVVKARLKNANRRDVDDAVSDVRLATLRALDDAVRARVDLGESEDEAAQVVLTREFIASIASRRAKEAARKIWSRRRMESFDETTSPVASEPARIETRELAANLSSAWSRQIYLALSDGYSTRQISDASGIAVARVRAEIRRIRAALGSPVLKRRERVA